MRIHMRLLGSLEISSGDRLIHIEAGRLRVVMAMLLFEANHVVPMSRLIDAIWDERPPATARSQVQICISALRRLLSGREEGMIRTRSPGYVLVLPDEAQDIRQFELLTARGKAAANANRTAEAVADLRAALELWRGPAAVGIESRIVRMAATRLDERRLSLLGDCLELELKLGRHHEILGELHSLVAEYPLNERLMSLLMLALYRAGRQADALESFRNVREMFQEELGLDPGVELCAMEQAILANDCTLELPPKLAYSPVVQPTPRQLPAALADFTGRDDILEQICGLLAPAEGTKGQHLRVVTLTGRGGIGKTTLALQAAHLVSEAFPDGQLYAQLQPGSGDPRTPASLLENFLRSFGFARTTLPDSVDERTAEYRSWLAGRRVLVVLDGADSLRQVLPVLPGSPTCAVIITTRSLLGGPDGALQFDIPVFDDEAAVRFLINVIGTDRVGSDRAAALRLVRLCDRLPLALRIIAAKLAARPHWPVAQMVRRLEDGRRRLDELSMDSLSVRDTIAFSYESLGKDERWLLARLSLVDSENFPAWVCAPLLDTDVATAADLLEELVAARLVQAWVSTDRSVRYHLHDLVRLFATEQLRENEPASESTATLTRLLGCWMYLADEAYQRECGGSFSLLHGNAPLWKLDDATVDELLTDPLGWFRHEHPSLVAAIHQAARAGFDELCWDLATTSVTLFEAGSYVDDWRTTHEAALSVVRAAGNRRGEAAVLCSLAMLAISKQLDDAERRLDTALSIFTELGDVQGQALALGQLAFVDRRRGREEQALVKHQQALAWFRTLGDLMGEISMLSGIAKIHLAHDDDKTAEMLLTEAARICERVRSRRAKAQTMYELGKLYLKRHDLRRAEHLFGDVLRSTLDAGDRIGQAHALFGTGTIELIRGDHKAAGESLTAALEAAQGTGHALVQGQILLGLAEVAQLCDDDAEATRRLEAARGFLRDLGSGTVPLAHTLDFLPQPQAEDPYGDTGQA